MTKRKLFWIAVPLLAVVGIGIAGAGYKHHGGRHNPERVVERVSEALDLNLEQKQKLEVVKEALLQGREEMRQEREDAMNQLIEQVRKPEMDQAGILAVIDQRKEKFDLLAPAVVAPIIEFHKSLTDEQRDKIVNLLETFRDWGHGHHRHG